MTRLKHIILSLGIALGVLGVVGIATNGYATAATPTQSACKAITGNNNCNDNSGSPSIGHIVKMVINILSLVIGIAAVIMIMVGGFRYITSGGDSNGVTAAKNTILYALIGLVVVAMAQFIVQFVLRNVT